MKYQDVPQLTKKGNYEVDVSWDYIEQWLELNPNHDLDPEFQRAHVWNEEKQQRYVEFILRGGRSATAIYWNCPDWDNGGMQQLVLVDGKQRMEAVRKFLKNELSIFDGKYAKDFQGRKPLNARFKFNVNNLKTQKKVLQWYLDINDGGIAHTTEEIEKVKTMLKIL